MRVLLTRSRDDSVELAQRLSAKGHETLISPVIEIVPLDEISLPEYCTATIATSRHALENIALQHRKILQKMLRGNPLYLVGNRTEATARALGFDQICCAAKDAASLATLILSDHPQGVLLYLAGRQRKRDLEDRLRAGGLKVETVEVYDARACLALEAETVVALRAGRLDAVMHFSRRSAKLFTELAAMAGLAPQAGRLRHICISPDAALGLSGFEAHNIVLASEPDLPSMLAALEAAP